MNPYCVALKRYLFEYNPAFLCPSLDEAGKSIGGATFGGGKNHSIPFHEKKKQRTMQTTNTPKIVILLICILSVWSIIFSFLYRSLNQQHQANKQLREELVKAQQSFQYQLQQTNQFHEDKLELVRQQLQTQEQKLQQQQKQLMKETEDNDLKKKQQQLQQQQQNCPPTSKPKPCTDELKPLKINLPSVEKCRERFGDLAMRKIYTYHQQIENFRNDTELLELWKMSWRHKCWEPIILDESHAAQHLNFTDLDTKLSALPTVNPKLYERTCYLRYVAMSTVGGGVTVDNDVMNMGFWPTDVPDPLPERLHVSASHIPTLMYAPGEEYDRVIRFMANYTLTPKDTYNKRPHTSDMYIMVELIDRGEVNRVPKDPFRAHEDNGKKLIHLSSALTLGVSRASGLHHLDKKRLTTILLKLV